MSESASGSEGFDLRGAIETIDRATSYHIPLRRRTEGVTWMVWGLATAVAFLTEFAFDPGEWVSWLIMIGLWPVLGIVATSAVWRIAALTRATLAPQASRTGAIMILVVLALAVTTMMAFAVYEASGSYLILAAALGSLPWACLAMLQWKRMTIEGQRAMVWTGVVIVLALLLYSGFLDAPGDSHPNDIVVTIGVLGGFPFSIGLWRVFRG